MLKGCGTLVIALILVGFLCFVSSGFLSSLGLGTLLPTPVLPTIMLPAEPISATTEVLGLKTGLTNTFLATLVADLVLVVVAYVGTRKLRAGDPAAMIPSGLQNFLEMVVEAVYNLAQGILGQRTRKVFWLGMTIFLFVLVANWMELVPGMDSIGWIDHPHEEDITGYERAKLGPIWMLTAADEGVAESGEHEAGQTEEGAHEGWVLVPFLRAASTDLNMPLALALISVLMTQVYGIQAQGFQGYLERYLRMGRLAAGDFIMGLVDLFVGALEAVAEFAKIISFTFRLFGNIFAGAVLLFVMSYLIPLVFPGVMVFYGLEVFVGAIQALVFMMLTFVFISVATTSHGDHGETH
jgi:F-type H+-transporting ATPase subunit a